MSNYDLTEYFKNNIKRDFIKCIDNSAESSKLEIISSAKYCFNKELEATNKLLPTGLQGEIKNTHNSFDTAILGKGFFIVKDDYVPNKTYLTRKGDWVTNRNGDLINSDGTKLLGYKLDYQGNQASELSTVNFQNLPPLSVPTTKVALGLNLRSSHYVLKGASQVISFDSSSSNYGNAEYDIISYENNLNHGDSITLTPSSTNTPNTYSYGGFLASENISSGILGASTATDRFNNAKEGWNFSITANYDTTTFTYEPNIPDTDAGQFNNLVSLADAINQTYGMSAKIDKSTNHLYFGPRDATQSWSISDNTGTFVHDLFNAKDKDHANIIIPAAANRFSTLAGLKNLISATNGLSTEEASPLGNTKLEFYTTDPFGTLAVSASAGSLSNNSTTASILSTLGLKEGVTSQRYDFTGLTGENIASGKVDAAYTVPIQMYDSLGTQHDFEVIFVKVANNKWAAEIYTHKSSDIISSNPYNQIASGLIEFNGDGTLKSITNSLVSTISINWANGANPSNVTFNWGTAGVEASSYGTKNISKSNGLSQTDSPFNSNFISQDGNIIGFLSSANFDRNGHLVANFNNGESKPIYKIPIANVVAPTGLLHETNNIYEYKENLAGALTLTTDCAGCIVPEALESLTW